MWTNIRYVLLTAIRDKLFAGLLIGVVFAAFVASAMGSTAMLEPEQMTIAFTAASVRIILMVGILVFIAFHIRNAFDNREMDLLLSRPISRTKLVVSYWLGFGLVGSLLTLPAIGIIALLGAYDAQGFLLWSISLLLESWLVVTLTLFVAMTFKSGVSTVLSALGFYTLSRMMGFFVATTRSNGLFELHIIDVLAKWTMKIISIIIPRADFFGKSSWLIYGVDATSDWWLCILQAACFIPLLLAATLLDFSRKQF